MPLCLEHSSLPPFSHRLFFLSSLFSGLLSPLFLVRTILLLCFVCTWVRQFQKEKDKDLPRMQELQSSMVLLEKQNRQQKERLEELEGRLQRLHRSRLSMGIQLETFANSPSCTPRQSPIPSRLAFGHSPAPFQSLQAIPVTATSIPARCFLEWDVDTGFDGSLFVSNKVTRKINCMLILILWHLLLGPMGLAETVACHLEQPPGHLSICFALFIVLFPLKYRFISA